MEVAILVGHRPTRDLLDVDLAAEDNAEVLFLLVSRESDANTLRLGDRAGSIVGRRSCGRKDNTSLDNEADRLSGVSKDLNRGRVVDAL